MSKDRRCACLRMRRSRLPWNRRNRERPPDSHQLGRYEEPRTILFKADVDLPSAPSSILMSEPVCGDGAHGSPSRSSAMCFMFIVNPAHPGPPTPELMEAVHKLADREIKAGRILDSGGMMATR